jgi:hypothetical protein
MIKYVTITIICVFVLYSCILTCEDVKKHCITLHCSFKITEKSKDKYIEFKGFDKNNIHVEFKEYANWKIYDFVEIGDTLYKELGKTDLILIKMDTTLVFPLICEGKIVE